MATIQRTFDSTQVDDGSGNLVTVAYWYAYDDATLWVTAVGCDNPGPGTAWAQASLTADGSRSYEGTTPPFTSRSFVVPTQRAQRLQRQVNPANGANGKLDGVSFLSNYSVG